VLLVVLDHPHLSRCAVSAQASDRLLLTNRNAREAFLRMPRDTDGTVDRRVVESHLSGLVGSEDAGHIMANIPDGAHAVCVLLRVCCCVCAAACVLLRVCCCVCAAACVLLRLSAACVSLALTPTRACTHDNQRT
jgi:hypothetical protein